MRVIIDIPDGTKFLGISYAIDNGNLTITAGIRAYTNIKDGDEYTIDPNEDQEDKVSEV